MMSPLENILQRLQKVKRGENGKHMALCPAHEDTNRSLSVTEGQDGRVLLNCFAGCEVERIVSALGLEMSDLFPSGQIQLSPDFTAQKAKKIKKEGATKAPEPSYIYHDEAGQALHGVIRTSQKKFFQCHRKNSAWLYGLKEIKPVIYRLPEILETIGSGETVFVVEGEKDADNAFKHDIPATTNPMGAGKWKEDFNKYFKNADVVIIPDNDEPGRKHAQDVAKNIVKTAKSVKVLELPNLPKKGDLSDWLAENKKNTRDKLIQLAEAAPAWEPPEEPETKQQINNTDLGNAQRLVEIHGKNVRYSHEAKKWYHWNGKYWEQDRTGRVLRMAKDVPREMYRQASIITDDDDRKNLIKHALRSENENRIRALVNLAQSEPGIPILLSQFDTDPFSLNCKNGTIDLKTGELRQYKRNDYITKISPVNYDPNAKSEVWEHFLERILPDKEVRKFVQRFAGYSISGSIEEEVFAFPYGPAATGKSTFLRALTATLGDYAATADFESFLVNKNGSGGPRNDIARLAGKRFVVSIEVADGRKLAENLLKQLTGGDTVTTRFLYQESFEFVPQFKLWLAANYRPRVSGSDDAIWRRLLQIPFVEQIPSNERDPKLKNILCNIKETGPSILAWLVEGCLEWQQQGLAPPMKIIETTDDYRIEMDPLAEFLEDRCIIASHTQVSNPELWKEYKTWCEENGERYSLGRKRFSQELFSKGLDQYHDGKRRIWTGIGLAF